MQKMTSGEVRFLSQVQVQAALTELGLEAESPLGVLNVGLQRNGRGVGRDLAEPLADDELLRNESHPSGKPGAQHGKSCFGELVEPGCGKLSKGGERFGESCCLDGGCRRSIEILTSQQPRGL
jgi:hypothetical protein